MRRRDVVTTAVLAACLCLATAGSGSAQGKSGPKPDSAMPDAQSSAAPSARKDTVPANNKNAPESATRQSATTCDFKFVNTGWNIHRVWVDRRFVGSISSSSDAILRDVGTGPTELYAEADFTDGSVLKWGPQISPCAPYTTQIWRLYR
jgi:hypothetical protein